MAYGGFVRPVPEYASPAWDHRGKNLQNELGKVQIRAARFVTGNNNYQNGRMTNIMKRSKWETLSRLMLL